jgi:hypothetical protein
VFISICPIATAKHTELFKGIQIFNSIQTYISVHTNIHNLVVGLVVVVEAWTCPGGLAAGGGEPGSLDSGRGWAGGWIGVAKWVRKP